MSESVEVLLGFKADDFLTEKVSLQSRIHTQDQDIAEVLFSKNPSKISHTFNIRFRHADGRIRCIKAQYTKVKNQSGKGILLELLLQDAKSLWQQQGDQTMMANFKAMMENSDDYIYFKDRNHVFTGASQTLVAITEPSEHWTDLIGKTDYDVFPEEYADIYYELEKQVFSGIEVAHEEQETLDFQGNKGWVDNRKYPIKNAEGDIVGLFGIARDITDNKLAEEAVRASMELFRTIFEQAPLGVALINSYTGHIYEVNPKFASIAGRTQEEMAHIDWISITHPEDVQEDLDNMVRLNAMEIAGFSMDKRYIHPDGNVVWISMTIAPLKEKDGNHKCHLCMIEDITERKANEFRVGFLANHDRLTELPNRELFYDRLSQAISQARRKNEGIALLFLDLDGFKPVNDAYGHEAGDVVLKVVAKRLQACVRNMDTVARMGGDEFAVILSALQSPLDAELVAQKIIQNIGEVIKLNTTTACVVGVSIGIAIYPDNGTEIDMLMHAADGAMYESKAAGKNTYTVSRLQHNPLDSNAPWINLAAIPRLGIQEIDDQHLKIVGMLNVLNDAIKHAKPLALVTQLLDDLIGFTDYHFKTEERLMHEYGYPAELEHQNIHEHLLHEIAYLKGQFEQGGELVFLQKLKDWFTIHITSADKPLADFIMAESHGRRGS